MAFRNLPRGAAFTPDSLREWTFLYVLLSTVAHTTVSVKCDHGTSLAMRVSAKADGKVCGICGAFMADAGFVLKLR